MKELKEIYNYLKENISYGWIDINGKKHIGNTKNIRKLYKIQTIEETINNKIGTCIEQCNLIKYLLNKKNIKNNIFATRIYEPNNYNKLNREEHLHIFILAYINNYVYHIETANTEKIGIYKYKNELEALNKINEYYINLNKNKISRPITKVDKIIPNLSFKEFNNYLNDLDNITIIEYNKSYLNDIKELLVELEEYIISIDEDKLDRLHPDYKDKMAILDLKEIKQNNGKCYIAIKNNKVVGLIMGIINKYDKYDYLDYTCPKCGKITELIVSKDYRKLNIGNKLINTLEQYFIKEKCEYVKVDVFAYNKNANIFYEKNNYHNRMYIKIKKLEGDKNE